jgi:hypothetical protein
LVPERSIVQDVFCVTDDLLLVRDDDVIDAVVAHQSRRLVDAVVLRDRVDGFGHHLADRAALLETGGEVGGGDDPHRLAVGTLDGDGVDAVFLHHRARVLDRVVGAHGQDALGHQVVDLCGHCADSFSS